MHFHQYVVKTSAVAMAADVLSDCVFHEKIDRVKIATHVCPATTDSDDIDAAPTHCVVQIAPKAAYAGVVAHAHMVRILL